MTILPGLLLALGVAIVAQWLGGGWFGPITLTRPPLGKAIEPVMIAIVLGMILCNALPLPRGLAPGFKFTAKRVLPLAIILLGARLDFVKVLQAGAVGIVLSVATILAGIGLFLLFIRLGWVSKKLGLLLGIGTAICGGTAIVAAQPIVRARDEEVSFGVATVTLLGLIAMFLMPLAGHALAMSQEAFGIWAGLSIHQTPQVVAAGLAFGPAAGDTATIVKLARVCLLAPVLLVVLWGLASDRRAEGDSSRGGGARWREMFPLFVIGFIAMAVLKTLGWLPTITLAGRSVDVARACEEAAKWLIVLSMAAVGLETRASALRQTGARPLLLGALAATLICGGILACLRVTGY